MTRVLLLTGATGRVGREVSRSLAAPGVFDGRIALVRPASLRNADENFVCVPGDVTKPDLGLAPAVARDLAHQVTDIVHAAGDTRFLAPPSELARANVEGTERVLEFAERCPRLRRLTHVSTVYVAGLTTGRIDEARSAAARHANAYQRSKQDAEEAVFAACPRLPASIVRSSTWLDDAVRVARPRASFVHALLRALDRPLLPFVHVDLDARIDAVSSEWAADALVACHFHAEPGGVFHLVAGEEAPSVRDALALVEEEHRAFGDTAYVPPRIVDAATYEGFLDDVRRTGPPLVSRIVERLESFLPHFRIRQIFDDRRAAEVLAGRVGPRPVLLESLRRVVRACGPNRADAARRAG